MTAIFWVGIILGVCIGVALTVAMGYGSSSEEDGSD